MPALLQPTLALLVAVLLSVVAVGPAAAAGDEVTGDVTAPELHSLSVEPAAFDVTTAEGVATVTVRLTDENAGVMYANLSWQRPGPTTHGYTTSLERVSGDAFDGVYQARLQVPKGEVPGAWPLQVQSEDRVRNLRQVTAADLESRGFVGRIDVSNSDVDDTAPELLDVEVVTPQVDVRSGPSSTRIRMRVADAGSGTASVTVFINGPNASSGGAQTPHLTLVEGTAADGWWQGDVEVLRYAHTGEFTFVVRPFDAVNNTTELVAEDLAARGLPTGFEVLSEPDLAGPDFVEASLSAVELDVSDADQEVVFEAGVRDDLAGVLHYPWQDDFADVQVSLQHPLGQLAGSAGMPRVAGTALDGTYRARFVVPRASATGLWRLQLYASDEIGNDTYSGVTDLAELGLPPAVLVYDTPLPPLDVDAQPADESALVQWSPPSDERGAEVTGYVVRDAASTVVARADADDRSVVVPGLSNGTTHQLVVHALNRAGESAASSPVRVVPQEGLVLPASVRRLSGTDRTATALTLSQDAFGVDGAAAVVLARDDDYADALAGTPLAARRQGPLLITPSSGLDRRVLEELRRVLPAGGTVLLLGGEKALSPAVESAVRAAGLRPQRLAGADRFATAVAVAEAVTADPRQVLLATGRSFADALGAGAAAAASGAVVVLTDDDRLPAATAAYLQRHAGTTAVAVGGPASRALPSATAVVGRDRYATAVLVAQRYPGRGAALALATGERFPDALAGGAHAARHGAPLLLTAPGALPAVVAEHIDASAAREVFVYGGPAAVTEPVLSHVRRLVAS